MSYAEYLTDKQRLEEDEDMARKFEDIRYDASLPSNLWSMHTAQAHLFFEERCKELFQHIAQNYGDEAEIGRFARHLFGDSIDESIEEG